MRIVPAFPAAWRASVHATASTDLTTLSISHADDGYACPLVASEVRIVHAVDGAVAASNRDRTFGGRVRQAPDFEHQVRRRDLARPP